MVLFALLFKTPRPASGVYYKPGSLKAKLCTEGMKQMYAYCDANKIKTIRCGKLIVAVEPDELPQLKEIQDKANQNGVQGVVRLNETELRKIEPHCCGLSAVYSPNTGIVDFAEVRVCSAFPWLFTFHVLSLFY